MIIKSNTQNDLPVSDPLQEALQNTLPLFAQKLNINQTLKYVSEWYESKDKNRLFITKKQIKNYLKKS